MTKTEISRIARQLAEKTYPEVMIDEVKDSLTLRGYLDGYSWIIEDEMSKAKIDPKGFNYIWSEIFEKSLHALEDMCKLKKEADPNLENQTQDLFPDPGEYQALPTMVDQSSEEKEIESPEEGSEEDLILKRFRVLKDKDLSDDAIAPIIAYELMMTEKRPKALKMRTELKIWRKKVEKVLDKYKMIKEESEPPSSVIPEYGEDKTGETQFPGQPYMFVDVRDMMPTETKYLYGKKNKKNNEDTTSFGGGVKWIK